MSELKDSKVTGANTAIDVEMVEKLTEGFVNIYEPTLKSMRKQLLEIIKKQENVTQEMHALSLNLHENLYDHELQNMFDKIKIYKDKLIVIKKNMINVQEQSSKLKKRALKLEQQKQKEMIDKAEKQEYEELLVRKSTK